MLQPVLKSVLTELDPRAIKARAMGQDVQATLAKQGAAGSFDIELPGAQMGKVVTRFPPEPSGTQLLLCTTQRSYYKAH